MPDFARSDASGSRGAAPKRRVAQLLARVRQVAAPRRAAAACRLAAWFGLTFTAACSGPPLAPRPIHDCPAAIHPTDQIHGDFTLREQVTVRFEGGDFPFELVAQKRQRELVLVGLSPMGAKLFTVVQTGSETEVDALPGAVLPIPPLNVLRDLHRLRFSVPDATMSEPDPAEIDHPDCGYSIRFEGSSVESLP